MEIVLTDEFEEFLAAHGVLHEREFHHVHVAEVVECVVFVIHVSHTATHACSEVSASLAKHHHTAACHVLAAVVACTFHHSDGTRIAHGKAFTHTTVHVQFTAGGTIQSRVAGNDVVLCHEVGTASCWRQDADASAAESLAEIVVGFTFQTNVQTFHGEGTERLSCRALELDLDSALWQSFLAIFLGNRTRQHRAHGSIRVLDGVVEGHFLLVLDGFLSRSDDVLILHATHLRELTTIPVEWFVSLRLVEQTGKVNRLLLVSSLFCMYFNEFRMTNDVFESMHTHLREIFAHLFSQEREEVHHVVSLSSEASPQGLVLCGHTDRAGVGVALAHHHTSQHDERQCAE